MSEKIANSMFRSRHDINKEEVDYFYNALTNLLSPLGKTALSDWLGRNYNELSPSDRLNQLFLFIESDTGFKD